MTMRVLILGGTSAGRLLAERLARDPRYDALLSFAGRTVSLQRPDVPHRVGGFGGVAGLATFLERERFAALVDATHPFAAQMSAHAVHAAARTHVPLIRIEPSAWLPEPGDRWIDAPDMAAAAEALGLTPRRVLLTVGRLEVAAFARAPQHFYLIRAVDPFEPNLPQARVLAARGPFALEEERIERIVGKNSGTAATHPKLVAARMLGLTVIMVARPQVPAACQARSLDEVLGWLAGVHGAASIRRGE
jgi:precorrin-6A/cobalt-precorrin-6A reductase